MAVASLVSEGKLPPPALGVPTEVSDTRNPEHGDYASNFALVAAKPTGMNPRQVGEFLREALLVDAETFLAVDIAGPGFLNLKLRPEFVTRYVTTVLDLGQELPRSKAK